jgi:hypothetical protein
MHTERAMRRTTTISGGRRDITDDKGSIRSVNVAIPQVAAKAMIKVASNHRWIMERRTAGSGFTAQDGSGAMIFQQENVSSSRQLFIE